MKNKITPGEFIDAGGEVIVIVSTAMVVGFVVSIRGDGTIRWPALILSLALLVFDILSLISVINVVNGKAPNGDDDFDRLTKGTDMKVDKILRGHSDDPIKAFAKIESEIGIANLTRDEATQCIKVACKFVAECKKMRSYSIKWLDTEIEARRIRVKLRDRISGMEADELAQLESKG